jgi:hypothetical protein
MLKLKRSARPPFANTPATAMDMAMTAQADMLDATDMQAMAAPLTLDQLQDMVGSTHPLDPDLAAQFIPLMAQLQLSHSHVAQLLALYSEAMGKVIAATIAEQEASEASRQQAARMAQMQQWRQQIEQDAHVGGDKLPETVGYARRALDVFSTPDVLDVLEESGLGNHPGLLRLLARIGRDFASEDGTPPVGAMAAGASGRGASSRAVAAARLFGRSMPRGGMGL